MPTFESVLADALSHSTEFKLQTTQFLRRTHQHSVFIDQVEREAGVVFHKKRHAGSVDQKIDVHGSPQCEPVN